MNVNGSQKNTLAERLGQALALHKIIRLRQRKIMTRSNRVRLRYVSACFLFLSLAATFAFKGAGQFVFTHDQQIASIEPAGGDVELALAGVDDVASSDMVVDDSLQQKISGGIRKASLATLKKIPSGPQNAQVQVGRGETIAGVLEDAGVSGDDAYAAVKALSQHVNPRTIRAGQLVNIQFRSGAGDPEFARMTLNIDPLKQVTVRKEDDRFVSDLKEKELRRVTYAGYAEVQNSLYGSAERAGIPPQALADILKIYSRNVDFQRDVQKGDRIEVLFEGMETEDGKLVKYKNVLYANLTIGGRNMPLYRFEDKDGRADYYDEKGRSTRKTLLKTPIDGARMSSGFGMRRHPILGYSKMHKGVDFAAPTGTPIYAAGDGIISFVGRKSGYGNYISIKHNSTMQTAYAHMSRFASGMRSGTRVRQGDVIGYVGSTGRSTGPHLHYEILISGRQVNPRGVNLPTGQNLAGPELNRFKRTIRGVEQQYASLRAQSVNVARNNQKSDSDVN
jgi:murein DD-endopeptidase MepM/ murein hydrolase activator NlpD